MGGKLGIGKIITPVSDLLAQSITGAKRINLIYELENQDLSMLLTEN